LVASGLGASAFACGLRLGTAGRLLGGFVNLRHYIANLEGIVLFANGL
jgi:hypothetical protein